MHMAMCPRTSGASSAASWTITTRTSIRWLVTRWRRSGRTISCTICHGDSLKGLGNVPRLAGLFPIYIARQIYLFKDGTRNGIDAQLMKKAVAKLTDDDIVALSAYLGSLTP